jgi:hypothetical protein
VKKRVRLGIFLEGEVHDLNGFDFLVWIRTQAK